MAHKQKKQKYYVVWQGVTPGIYTTWDAAKQQTQGYDKALYKAFDTLAQAQAAYADSPWAHLKPRTPHASQHAQPSTMPAAPPTDRHDTVLPLPLAVTAEAWAVDAACSGNPGRMEYRGVCLQTGAEIFHLGPIWGTNNIGEFLAIVHALALMQQQGVHKAIYSDSRNAIAWVKHQKCKTTLPQNAKSQQAYDLIQRAEAWLHTHPYTIPIYKWETSQWGEIPADFGRK